MAWVLSATGNEGGPESTTQQEETAGGARSAESRSGYEEVPTLGGPSSVGAQLEKDDKVKKPVFRFDNLQRLLKPYYDFKARVQEQYGLAFGGDYILLYQGATDSLGEDEALGGVFRFFGNWTLFGRKSGDTGSLVYKVENRSALGTTVAPQDLGFQLGYANLTAGPFTDIGWGVTNLFWQQHLLNHRLAFQAGVLDATDYVNFYGLINPWTAFSNLAFLIDSTIPVPNQGLGAVLGAMPGNHVYVIAGVADANGDATRSGFDTFFNENEYFTHIEVGWTPSYVRRYLDNIHVTAWHADKREQANIPDGWGVAFSAAWFVQDRWMPFVRAGYAEDGGAVYDRSVSAGLGYYFRRRSDLMALGFNWGQPSDTTFSPGLNDQYTTELFYRLQLSPNFALTPDLQLLFDPALNPNEDVIAEFGLRARLAL